MTTLHKCNKECCYGGFCEGWSVVIFNKHDGDRTNERWGGMTQKEARKVYESSVMCGEPCELVNPEGQREQAFDPGVVTVKKVIA